MTVDEEYQRRNSEYMRQLHADNAWEDEMEELESLGQNSTCPATGKNDDFVDLRCILIERHDHPDQHVDPVYGYWYGDDVTDYSLTGQ